MSLVVLFLSLLFKTGQVFNTHLFLTSDTKLNLSSHFVLRIVKIECL
jgi:hypothetical protein